MISFRHVYNLFRFEIADDDEVNNYRFSYENIMQWFHEAVHTLISLRPDLAIGQDFMRIGVEPFRFELSERVAISGFERVIGWDHLDKPEIVCIVDYGNKLISLSSDYVTRCSADLNYGLIFLSPDSNTPNPFYGSLNVGRSVRSSITFDVKAIEQPIYISDRYIQSIVHYMAYLSFLKDSEDTGNANRSTAYLQLFQNEVQAI